MKKILLLLLTILSSVMAWSAEGDTFTAICQEGIKLTYTIVSESGKTCETGIQTSIPSQGTITLPANVNGYRVIGIGYRSFRETGIKSLIVPSGITYIGEEAFEGCNYLSDINIPNGVTTINRQAFKDCNSLTSITIPGSVNIIWTEAFRECKKLSTVIIGEGVETISSGVFSSCTALSTINFPSTIISVGDNAFSNTYWNNNLPEGLTYIGKIAYKYKDSTSGTVVTIKSGIKAIQSYAFSESNVTSSL